MTSEFPAVRGKYDDDFGKFGSDFQLFRAESILTRVDIMALSSTR